MQRKTKRRLKQKGNPGKGGLLGRVSMSAGDIRMRPAGSPNRSIRSRHTLYHVTYLWRLEVSGLVTLGVVIV